MKESFSVKECFLNKNIKPISNYQDESFIEKEVEGKPTANTGDRRTKKHHNNNHRGSNNNDYHKNQSYKSK